ncbi:MAG TPA: hypothetical protein VK906_03020 [Egicoccus sp.]|nr:hypothetical protein [Egicoccus sp.]HSK22116.1 hypothetical protein [Egicoccus sp.]
MNDSPIADAADDLLRGTLRVLALVAILVAVGAGVLAGSLAGLSALIGVAFVAVLFGVSTAMLAWSARRSAGSALGMLAGAMVGRLILYAAALSALAQVDWVHRTSLALATAVAVALTLAYELRTLSRMPRLFWIDADASQSAALDTTRSR